MSQPDKPNPESQHSAGNHTRDLDSLGGVLIIDKPVGPTSMDIVDIVRRRAGGVRTGHAGTLDPLASGVLVLALGSATKLIDRLMKTDKRYQAVVDLSAFTVTDDAQGERTEVPIGHPPSEVRITQALANFIGRIQQRPPSFSAVKVGGQRAYKAARQGKPFELPPRDVQVHSIDLQRYEWPLVALEIHCDKGFYVRSLARDLGKALGTGGFCANIRRTAVGPFTLSKARTLGTLSEALAQDDLLNARAAMNLIQDLTSIYSQGAIRC